jgi:hypothetical protein
MPPTKQRFSSISTFSKVIFAVSKRAFTSKEIYQVDDLQQTENNVFPLRDLQDLQNRKHAMRANYHALQLRRLAQNFHLRALA